MIVRHMPNSDPWGPPGIPFMTIFVFYVNPQIPNIEYLEANEVYKSLEVSHPFFSSNFPSNAVRIMSGDPFLTRVMTIFIKTYIFVKVREGRGGEGREGRVKNGSPDMIPTAFEGKFDEKKDEIPPGICRPHLLQNIQYWEFER